MSGGASAGIYCHNRHTRKFPHQPGRFQKMKQITFFIGVILALLIVAGCAGGEGSNPLIPDTLDDNQIPSLTGNTVADTGENAGHLLWGYWQVIYDTGARNLELVPLRGITTHMNLARLLGNSPVGLSVEINSLDIPNKLLDFDLTITHPVPGSNLRGFDVRGILMGPGETMAAQSDPSLVYCSLDGTRLLNADGYTRWWNAVEFTDPGLFGYENNFVIPDFLVPTTTLNPYKYFSDPLGPNDPVVPGVNETNRGTFSTDGDPPSVTRNYQVRFPIIADQPKLGFHYAIDASFERATGGSMTPKPVEDFPPAANCPEPFHIKVNSDNSSVYYEGLTSLGGHLVLDIEVFDWGATDNPDGVNGEIDAIIIESPTLFDGMMLVDLTSMLGTQSTSAIFHITIPDVTPTDIDGQEVLVTVRSSAPTSYAPPMSNVDYPEQAALAAYTIVDVAVSPIKPSGVDDYITVLEPNGGECWIEGNIFEIRWEASESIPNVMILLSDNSGQDFTDPIQMATPNDGSFLWYIEPSDIEGNNCRIKITDVLPTGISDESDADFIIFDESDSAVMVTSPNGGEIWKAQTSQEITWDAEPEIENMKIELSTDDGATYPLEVIESTPNTGSFTWDPIPDIAVGENNRIRITSVENPTEFDVSNETFSIKPMGDSFIEIDLPVDADTWQIGCIQQVEWSWDGGINAVEIFFKRDGEVTWTPLAEGVTNIGWELVNFEPEGINDLAHWDSLVLTGIVRVEDSGDPGVFDEVPVIVPINLGILWDKVQASEDGDADTDNIPDDIELFIGTDPLDRDCDIPNPDSFFDNYEIFGDGYFDPYDLIPDEDGDGVIAPLDMDDNSDGVNDGEEIDTDLDGIANYLEYYGYTYDWMSGTYNLWNGSSIDEPYFKTDPMQPSTDQDPYSDSMEVSGAFMDVSVLAPGDYPMIPAYPNIIVRLEGYEVTVNEDITLSEGNTITKDSQWSTETTRGYSSTFEYGWEAGIGTEVGYDQGPKAVLQLHTNYHMTMQHTNTTAVMRSQGGSAGSAQEWSRATCTNATEAAHIKLFLKVYNQGTSCASNILPTITLKIGNMNIKTFEPASNITTLEPNGVYPAQPNTYWVVDRIDTGMTVPIALTLDELRALECGAPVSIVMTQMSADVMLMNESGQWESAGQWGEYMARCEAVCANMFLETGTGMFLHYLIYADDEPTAPTVTLGDALVWGAGAGTSPTELWITYTDENGQEQQGSLDEWDFCIDPDTLINNGFTGSPLEPPVPDYNIADLVLYPSTQVLGKIPREQLDEDDGPEVIYALYDNMNSLVKVLATDYRGVSGVEFLDNAGGTHDMDEIIAESGLYVYYLDSGYEYDGTELVRAYSLDSSVPYAEAPVEKLVYPSIPEPVAPVITENKIYLAGRMFRVKVSEDSEWPVQSVTAQWSCDPQQVTLFKGAPYGDDPNAWYCLLPDCVTPNNDHYLNVTASVNAETFDTRSGLDAYQGARAEKNDLFGQAYRLTDPKPDEYWADWTDLDTGSNGYLIWKTNSPDNQNLVDTHNASGGTCEFAMINRAGRVELNWFYDAYWRCLPISIYEGPKEFRHITYEDILSAEFFTTYETKILTDCTPEITFPVILLYQTAEGRFGKLRVRQEACYNYSSADVFYFSLDLVTYPKDNEINF